MTTDLDHRATAFSETVRLATLDDHRAAEGTPFVAALLAGELPVEEYGRFLGQLWFVYDALERAGDALASDPVVAPFLFEELRRAPALAADLTVVVGADWRSSIAPLPATRAYADRLVDVGRTWPGGYVAHHYTRSLGDLSGGRMIGRVVQRTLGFDPRRGASFYDFPGIASPNRFKVDYRSLLDAAPWGSDERNRIVDEVRAAFRHNRALFDDLEASRGG